MPDVITMRFGTEAPQMSEVDFTIAVNKLGTEVRPSMEFYTRLNVIAPDADRARGAFLVELSKRVSDVDKVVWRKMPNVGTRRHGGPTDIEWVAQGEFMVVPR